METIATIATKDFLTAIKTVKHAVGTTKSHAAQSNAVHFECSDGLVSRVVATDGHRMAFKTFGGGDYSVVVSVRWLFIEALADEAKESGEPVVLNFDQDRGVVRASCGDFSTENPNKVPPYHHIVNRLETCAYAKVSKKSILDSLKTLVGKDKSTVRIQALEGLFVMSCGDKTSSLTAQAMASGCAVSLDPDYLVDALKACDSKEITVVFGANEGDGINLRNNSPVLFKDSGELRAVVMPRLS